MDDFESRTAVPLDELGQDAYHYEWVHCTGRHFTASEGTDQEGNDLILVMGWDEAGEQVVWEVAFDGWDEVRFLARSQGATEAVAIELPEDEESLDGVGITDV